MSSLKNKKGNFFSKTIFIFQIILFLFLAASYLAPYIAPSTFWPIAFLGLVFPILYLIQVVFLVFWLLFNRKYAFYTFIFLLLGIFSVNKNIAYSFGENNKQKTKNEISILTFNVKVFDLYDWKNNKKSFKIFKDYLKNSGADVLCLQEFYSDDDNEYINQDELAKEIEYKYKTVFITKKLNKTHNWGIAIYSKFPIINTGNIKFENKANNAVQFADIKIKNDTIRVFNAHLQSVHFSENDYELVEKLKNEQIAEVKGSKKIASRLKKAFLKREKQVQKLRSEIEKSNYKTIVCGDFNDTPNSYTYQQISSVLKDSFLEKGQGIGATYNGKIPFLRIDYIFVPKLCYISYTKVDQSIKQSDHFPVITTINLSDE